MYGDDLQEAAVYGKGWQMQAGDEGITFTIELIYDMGLKRVRKGLGEMRDGYISKRR